MRIIITTLLIMCSLTAISLAQEVKIKVNGMVDYNYEPLKMADVRLLQDGTAMEKVLSTEAGTFSFTLMPDKVYEIAVTKEGFITKKLLFDTHMPKDAKGDWIIEFAVGLFKPCPGLNTAVLEQPVSKVVFNSSEREFNPDEDYTNKVSSRFREIGFKNEDCWNEKYDELINEGDVAYRSGNYAKSRDHFNNALEIFPDEKYPQKQLDKISEKLKDLNAIEKLYAQIIKDADQKATVNELIPAISLYKKALVFKPGDNYAKQQLTILQDKINKKEQAHTSELLAQQEQAKLEEQRLNDLLDKGERLMNENNYEEALSAFNQAISISPDDGYIKSMIEKAEKNIQDKNAEQARQEQEIANKLALESKKEENFKAAIAKGDNLKNIENYEQALLAYNQAVAIKPDSPLAQQKRSEVEKAIREKEALEAQKQKQIQVYTNLISQADALFTNSKYADAKNVYQQAQNIDNQNTYPVLQIQKIDDILARQSAAADREKALEKQFNTLLTSGEQYLKEENAAEAIKSFEQALLIKNNDGYTLALISKAKKMLEEQQNLARLENQRNEKQKEFQNAINSADNLFALKEYNEAISFYNQAVAIKPGDTYALQQKNKAERLIVENQEQAKYQGIITSADAMFNSKNYQTAGDLYANALKIKANDPYAKSKISEINTLIERAQNEALLQQENEKKYQRLVSQADAKMVAKEYEPAMSLYDEALLIKPEENYPKQQKNSIQKELALLAKELAYQGKIEMANNAFTSGNYLKARQLYSDASAVNPSEEFPNSKINEIDKILAELKAEQELEKANAEKAASDLKQYNNLIAAADKKYNEAYYSEAKKIYQDALVIKTNEPYPISRIRKIDETLALLGRGNESSKIQPVKSNIEDTKSTPLKDIKFASNRELEDYLKELKTSYPAGITHEVYENSKSTTNRFVVIRGDEVVEIREVRHSWGGVDFSRNGKPITLGYFKQQTEVREGEYYKKINK